jgi:hypothetical protein
MIWAVAHPTLRPHLTFSSWGPVYLLNLPSGVICPAQANGRTAMSTQPPPHHRIRDTKSVTHDVGEPDFEKRLMDEYRILQEKIDKIGGFRISIKGWSVTAVIAASAAGTATASLSRVLSVSLAIMLGFFFKFEFEQVKLSRIFGARARKLEASLRLMRIGFGNAVRSRLAVPNTAHDIFLQRYEQRLFRKAVSKWSRKRTGFWKRFVNSCRIAKEADLFFYAVMICVAFLLPLLTHRHSTTEHIEQIKARSHSLQSRAATSRPPDEN